MKIALPLAMLATGLIVGNLATPCDVFADTAGPGDPGVMPCAPVIDWTTQRQPPATYAHATSDQLLTLPLIEEPEIEVTTLPPIDGGHEPSPVPLPAAGVALATALACLMALRRRRNAP